MIAALHSPSASPSNLSFPGSIVTRSRDVRHTSIGSGHERAIARTFAPGQKRTILTDMAQTWLQLAEGLERDDQPVMQQQQVQPKDDDKKE